MHCDMYQFSNFLVNRIWLISRFLLFGHFGRHLTTLAMISNFFSFDRLKGMMWLRSCWTLYTLFFDNSLFFPLNIFGSFFVTGHHLDRFVRHFTVSLAIISKYRVLEFWWHHKIETDWKDFHWPVSSDRFVIYNILK